MALNSLYSRKALAAYLKIMPLCVINSWVHFDAATFLLLCCFFVENNIRLINKKNRFNDCNTAISPRNAFKCSFVTTLSM